MNAIFRLHRKEQPMNNVSAAAVCIRCALQYTITIEAEDAAAKITKGPECLNLITYCNTLWYVICSRSCISALLQRFTVDTHHSQAGRNSVDSPVEKVGTIFLPTDTVNNLQRSGDAVFLRLCCDLAPVKDGQLINPSKDCPPPKAFQIYPLHCG